MPPDDAALLASRGERDTLCAVLAAGAVKELVPFCSPVAREELYL